MKKERKHITILLEAQPMPPTPVQLQGKQIYNDHEIDEIMKVLGCKVEDRNLFMVQLSSIAYRFLIEKPVPIRLSRKDHLANVDNFIGVLQFIVGLEKHQKTLVADLIDYPVRLTREEAAAAFGDLQKGAVMLLAEAALLRSQIANSKPGQGGKPTGTDRDPSFKRMLRELTKFYREYRRERPVSGCQVNKRVFRFIRACIIPLEKHSNRELVVLDKRGRSTSLNNMVIDVLVKDGWMKDEQTPSGRMEQDSAYIKHLRRKYSRRSSSK